LVLAPAKSEKDAALRPALLRFRLLKQSSQLDSNDQFLAGAAKRHRILGSVPAQQFLHFKRRNFFERPAVEGNNFIARF
jgi:hypothetical protein